MDTFCWFLILGLIANQATCMNIRDKRQIDDSADDLEDINALDNGINRRNKFPTQNVFPWKNPFDTNTDFSIISFPNEVTGLRPNQRPVLGQRPFSNQQQQTSSTAPSNGGSTTLSPSVEQCITTCPVTTEYNPVCGTNNVTYSNPGRLTCAQYCGVNVKLSRRAPCPVTTTAPI